MFPQTIVPIEVTTEAKAISKSPFLPLNSLDIEILLTDMPLGIETKLFSVHIKHGAQIPTRVPTKFRSDIWS